MAIHLKEGNPTMKKPVFVGVVLVIALASAVAGAQIQQRYNDLPPDHYAYDAALWAANANITQGCGDGSDFCPDATLSRGHMIVFLKRYHDWLSAGPTPSPPDAPPHYPTYEAAVAAADRWYGEMRATIGGGANTADWRQVIPQVYEKASTWTGNDLIAQRIANEASVMSRTGDPRISAALSSREALGFYTSAIAYAFARATSIAAQNGTDERDVASAAAWASAAAKLAKLAQDLTENGPVGDYFSCRSCIIAGYDGWGEERSSRFDWSAGALTRAARARNAYFELAS